MLGPTWRREDRDSGGPGRFRGGLGGSSCFVLHDTPARQIQMVFSGGGKALPQAVGLSGGYPGSTMHDVIVRESTVRASLAGGRVPAELEELGGTVQIIQPEDESDLQWNDVFYTQWQAGGGYGDPLLRDTQRVAYDVNEEKISVTAAIDIYGVVLDTDGSVDAEATERQRHQLRLERAGVA